MDDASLLEHCADVLAGNDRGRYAVPAAGLYPHQWNWDSAFAALGYAAAPGGDGRGPRAWVELATLMAAQDDSGFVPHIAFAADAGDYVPGPASWGPRRGGDGRDVSGITQPAVAATCARLLFTRDGDEQAARALLAPLARWHEWFATARRAPGGSHEPVVVHPWESGRDNAPEWDAPLEASPAATQAFQRVDTDHVDADQRPTKLHYEHYVGLVEWMRERSFDQPLLAAESPFRVLDTATSCILAAACDDLAWLAGALGEPRIAERALGQRDGIVASLQARAGADGSIPSWDLVADEPLGPVSCAQALLALAPGIGARSVEHAAALVAPGGALHSAYGVCSSSRLGGEQFSPVSYWRGPVWANITWLAALGMERAGRSELAAGLRARMLDYTRSAGLREYCNPDTGQGLGARDFTWTAALTAWELGRPNPA